MQARTVMTARTTPVSTLRLWAGRIISALVVAFMLFDGGIKVLQLAPATDASAQLGYSASQTLGVGLLALACLAVYLLPRTAILGAVLLTGYLGGAVATQVRVDAPIFSVVFPVIVGALAWGGLFLRDARLRALLPL